ncbi:MAG: molecular chaperone GrpE [Rickettsiales bacterium]|jgi:molecular chaperone GrpE
MTEEKIVDQENVANDIDPNEEFEPVLEIQESDEEQKIALLEEENKSLNDKVLRIAAELENTRKRSAEEVNKANRYALTSFAGDLVLVAENFYLASENLPVEEMEKSVAVKNFAEAMEMTKKELTKILEKKSIKRIYPLGEKFDHNFHEAISQIPAENDDEDGLVKQVMQAGYSIGERLIRPALVSVANKS